MVQKVIKCGVVGLTDSKRNILNREYDNLQIFLKNGEDKGLYSANKQQALRFYKKIKQKEYPISLRRDLIQIERKDTKLSKYWFRIRVFGRKKLWVAIKPHQDISEDVKFQESKILRKNNNFFVYLTIQKEIKIKKSYSSILGIDLGVKWIATVCDANNPRPVFYGKELRKVRGHYFNLRRKLSKKKIKGFYNWISNNKEKRIVNDLIHKISRNIVSNAIEMDSMIVIGKLEGIRKQSRGRRFNRKLNSFPFYKLKQQIKYKAEWEGIKVIEISEAYTSQICHKCGSRGIRKNGLFKCECGWEANSDYNGVLNIINRAFGQVSKVGVVVNQPRTETENIKIPISSSVNDFRSHHF